MQMFVKGDKLRVVGSLVFQMRDGYLIVPHTAVENCWNELLYILYLPVCDEHE